MKKINYFIIVIFIIIIIFMFIVIFTIFEKIESQFNKSYNVWRNTYKNKSLITSPI